ncbi:phosphatidylserine decarboxylase [Bermanella marisrubri]|uniref:Phosphatidylserine decarboxylase proenzyme n=1 Tax=Bermanella marisrubri TaxID=207949 RepID=Q1N258_9GAMM|nr:archaetidylserine decarboxylase [Bermanella marisrubri]EAT12306.1 phosphatidylserine decarboxylase [Bermanella marisrubri]QIZ85394.1 phosphatidylserine decarboxylase [Bermanella marisrubri]
MNKKDLFVLSQYLVPQHSLSRLVGWFASTEINWIKNTFIEKFAAKYDVNMDEALEEDLRAYKSFNDFFTRALKDGARPISDDKIVSPADGAVSQLGEIELGRCFQAKGRDFGVNELLGGDAERAEPFMKGDFATIYLSPKDYHRVHMPCDGVLKETVYVPGDLFSVNPATAEGVDGLFARNERLVCMFETEHGPMAMVLVGAMIVAGIETVWSGQVCPLPKKAQVQKYDGGEIRLKKGDEMGRFKLGSTVILCFPPDTIDFNDEIKAESPLKMGQGIAD